MSYYIYNRQKGTSANFEQQHLDDIRGRYEIAQRNLTQVMEREQSRLHLESGRVISHHYLQAQKELEIVVAILDALDKLEGRVR